MRKIIINTFRRLVRAVLIRLSEDVELMQMIYAGFSSAAFANSEFKAVAVVRGRDALLLKALERVHKDGLICEFGVYKGHTLKIIANALKDRPIYGFDSFEGLPEAWRSGFDKGAFKIEVPNDLSFPSNVKLYAGWFDSTLPMMLAEDTRKIAFLHIDCDLYSSTKRVLESLAGRLRPGTVIVFDEYFNFPGWENDEHRALIESARDFGFAYEYILYNPHGQQVAIIITKVNSP